MKLSNQAQTIGHAGTKQDIHKTTGRVAFRQDGAYAHAHSSLIEAVDALEYLETSDEPFSMSQHNELYELVQRVGEFAHRASLKEENGEEAKKLREQVNAEKFKVIVLEEELKEEKKKNERLTLDVKGLLNDLNQASATGESIAKGFVEVYANLKGNMKDVRNTMDAMGKKFPSLKSENTTNGLANHLRRISSGNDSHGAGTTNVWRESGHASRHESPLHGNLYASSAASDPEQSEPNPLKRRLEEAFEVHRDFLPSERRFSADESERSFQPKAPKRRRLETGNVRFSHAHPSNGGLRSNTTKTELPTVQVDGTYDSTSPCQRKSNSLFAKNATTITARNAHLNNPGRYLSPAVLHNSSPKPRPQTLSHALHTIVEEGSESSTYAEVEDGEEQQEYDGDTDSEASTQVLDELSNTLTRNNRSPSVFSDGASDKENSPLEPQVTHLSPDAILSRRNRTPERQFGDVLAANDVRSPDPPSPSPRPSTGPRGGKGTALELISSGDEDDEQKPVKMKNEEDDDIGDIIVVGGVGS